jgi:NADPH-dependent 2,4-dienoyl-CoA reductase/sulfur reductase-like enzyme
MLLDDCQVPGGQYFRRPPDSFQRSTRTIFDKDLERAQAVIKAAAHPRVAYLSNAVVWEAPEPNVLAFVRGIDSGRVRADCIVSAAGAFDRSVPFPGWTLPGVITAGGVQNLIKGQRVLPGFRVVVAGNGPLLFALAHNLHSAGARVVAVLELAPLNQRWREFPRLLAAPSILWQGLMYRATLLRAGIPVRTGETILEARGQDEVSAVVAGRVERSGQIDRSHPRVLECDTLAVGFGFTPSIEMTRLLGCEHHYDTLRGGWIPVRSEELETSVSGVFAPGDGAGIAGVEVALLEGTLVGLTVARRLGRCSKEEEAQIGQGLRARLARLSRFRRGIDRLYAAPENMLGLLTRDTVVCRCEEVTAGDLLDLLAKGVKSINGLKALTRITMGRCQGRNCLGTLTSLIGRELGCACEKVALPQARPPARPILLADLMHEELPPPKDPEMVLS